MALVTTTEGNYTLLTGTPIEVVTELADNGIVKDKIIAAGYDGTAFFAVY